MAVDEEEVVFNDSGSTIKIELPVQGHIGNSQIVSKTTSLVVKDTSGKELLAIPQLSGTVDASKTSWNFASKTFHGVEAGVLSITLHKLGTEKWTSLGVKVQEFKAQLQVTNEPEAPKETAQKPRSGSESQNAMAAREQVKRLFEAALEGDLSQVQRLAPEVSSEGLQKVKDGNARTALHFAAQGNSEDVARYLIDKEGIDVNCQDDKGETPMGLAAGLSNLKMMELLLNSRGRVDLPADGHPQPLHRAASVGSGQLIQRLLEAGADIEAKSHQGTPLLWAAGSGNAKAVTQLLDAGANCNAASEDGFSAILMASAAGDLEIAKALIKKGANVNIAATAGVTALHAAAELGDIALVEALVEAGADCNAKDDMNSTPLDAAAVSEMKAVVQYLMTKTTPSGDHPWTADEIIKAAESPPPEDKSVVGPPEDLIQELQQHEVNYDEKKAAALHKEGNIAFVGKDWEKALGLYNESLKYDVKNHTVRANRAAIYLRIGEAEKALSDARISRQLDPKYVKAWYREGQAAAQLEQWEDAALAYYEAYCIEPSKDMQKEFQNAVEAGRKAHKKATQQQEGVEKGLEALKLTEERPK